MAVSICVKRPWEDGKSVRLCGKQAMRWAGDKWTLNNEKRGLKVEMITSHYRKCSGSGICILRWTALFNSLIYWRLAFEAIVWWHTYHIFIRLEAQALSKNLNIACGKKVHLRLHAAILPLLLPSCLIHLITVVVNWDIFVLTSKGGRESDLEEASCLISICYGVEPTIICNEGILS